MFVKQRIRIPRVGNMRIGDIVLIDSRTLDTKSYTNMELMPIRKAWSRLQKWVTRQRRNTLVCGNDTSVEDRYNLALAEHQQTHPDDTTDDFDLVYEPDYDDTDLDPRLGALTFIVEEDGRGFSGLFNLYNVRIESKNPRRMVITASPAPSVTTALGYNHPNEIGIMMKALLERDIKFKKNPDRVLDLIQWDFPTRKSHAWARRPGDDPVAAMDAIDLLASHDKTVVDSDGLIVPKKIRRRS